MNWANLTALVGRARCGHHQVALLHEIVVVGGGVGGAGLNVTSVGRGVGVVPGGSGLCGRRRTGVGGGDERTLVGILDRRRGHIPGLPPREPWSTPRRAGRRRMSHLHRRECPRCREAGALVVVLTWSACPGRASSPPSIGVPRRGAVRLGVIARRLWPLVVVGGQHPGVEVSLGGGSLSRAP